MSKDDFWSRRRAAVAEEAEAEAIALKLAEAETTEAALAEKDDEELLEELGLSDPDTLNSPEAVREFLGSAVPQRLKTRALRRLWRLNPVLANLDGLVDYGEDFTDSATVIENLQTAYQVGKGMLQHVEALAAQKEAEALAETEEDPEALEDLDMTIALADDDTSDETPPFEAVESMAAPDQMVPSIEPAEEDLSPQPLARRRMQFEFETHA